MDKFDGLNDFEIDEITQKFFPEIYVAFAPSRFLDDANDLLTLFLSRQKQQNRFWNCTQELVIEQVNGEQVYIRKCTLFYGVAPDGVVYMHKSPNPARALTLCVLEAVGALEGVGNGVK